MTHYDRVVEAVAKLYWESEPGHMAWEKIECSKDKCYNFAKAILNLTIDGKPIFPQYYRGAK